jgi:hypothetical protein
MIIISDNMYDTIINCYYTFSQYSTNINIIIAKIIIFTKEQYPNISLYEILENIKVIFVAEDLPLPNITDTEIIDIVNNQYTTIINFENNYLDYQTSYDENVDDENVNDENVNDENVDDENVNDENIINIIETYNNIINNTQTSNYESELVYPIVSLSNEIEQTYINNNLTSFLDNNVKVVIDKNKIKKIRNKQYKFLSDNIKQMNKCCSICLDDYEPIHKVKVLPCNHAYHTTCITKWLTEQNYKCPICRKEIGETDDHLTISN